MSKPNQYYVRVIHSNTHEVIHEMQPGEFLDLYAVIVEKSGLISDRQV